MQYVRLILAAIFTGLAIGAATTGDRFTAACYTVIAVLWIAAAVLTEERR